MLGEMQLAALIGTDSLPLPDMGATEILGLTADSRAVKPGYLFAALPGTKLDGTAFIAQAIEQGAAALLVPQGATVEARVPVISDRNPRRRLALMAARFFGAQPATIAAVTGTKDRKSTRLNSSHVKISYAVFCLKKKKNGMQHSA